MGVASNNYNSFKGALLENLVASSLFNMKNDEDIYFNIYFDSRKGGVDFLVQRGFENPIPIEVGIGEKNKKQITNAINNYNSPFGIVISNDTYKIKK